MSFGHPPLSSRFENVISIFTISDVLYAFSILDGQKIFALRRFVN